MTLPPYRAAVNWFRGPASWLDQIGGVPKVKILDPSTIAVHRTHLPLIQEPRAEATLAALRASNDNAALRDALNARTAARGFALRPYQHAVPAFASQRRGVLVADMPRLGKTAMSLAAHDPARGPVMVVAPLSTRGVWIEWLRRYFPDEPAVLTGTTFDGNRLRGARVVFCHYDVLHAWQSTSFRVGTLILDEIHLLSNARGIRSPKRVKAAAFLAAHADQVLGLSGTPLWNRPVQLWATLELLCPRAFGSRFEFSQRYGAPQITPHGWKYAGASNTDELRARLSEVMIRRTWQDVRPDLPAVERTVTVVPLAADDALVVEAAAAAVRGRGKRVVEVGDLARYRRAVGMLKVPAAVEDAEQVLDAGEPVVVWTWHKPVAAAIQKALRTRAMLVTGDMTADARDAVIARWRASPEPAALVITMAVGQVGIDLSHARHAILCELDFTPVIVAQAEMRTYSPLRPGTVTYIVLDHEVERRLVETLVVKCDYGETLGVPAADAAIDVVKHAFDLPLSDAGDVDRLRAAFLATYAATD